MSQYHHHLISSQPFNVCKVLYTCDLIGGHASPLYQALPSRFKAAEIKPASGSIVNLKPFAQNHSASLKLELEPGLGIPYTEFFLFEAICSKSLS